jgi:hypothetical protein
VKALNAFDKSLAANRKRKKASMSLCSIANLHSTSFTCQQQQQQQQQHCFLACRPTGQLARQRGAFTGPVWWPHLSTVYTLNL